jgi:hypothetical protein
MTRRSTPARPKAVQQELFLSRGRSPYGGAIKLATDTSAAAAESVGLYRGGDLARAMIPLLEQHRAKTALGGVMLALRIRAEVYQYLVEHPEGATADEIAYALKYSILTVRPRVSELRKLRKITDSGVRRENTSGRTAIVWRIGE